MVVLTVVVAMMMIHHLGRPFPFPLPLPLPLPVGVGDMEAMAMDQVYVNEEERGRTY
jgi:hypothetical protein